MRLELTKLLLFSFAVCLGPMLLGQVVYQTISEELIKKATVDYIAESNVEGLQNYFVVFDIDLDPIKGSKLTEENLKLLRANKDVVNAQPGESSDLKLYAIYTTKTEDIKRLIYQLGFFIEDYTLSYAKLKTRDQ